MKQQSAINARAEVSAPVITFVSRVDLDARANLDAFISMCRTKLTIFGADLQFDDDTWDVTEAANRRALNCKETISFHAMTKERGQTPTAPMSEPFKSFAKAYIRYMHGLRPIKSIFQRLGGLRVLERVMLDSGAIAEPTSLTRDTFNRASQILAERYGRSAAYSQGNQLQKLAEFLDAQGLVAVPLRWKNSLRSPRDNDRVGPEFDRARSKKLPSASALNAIAQIYRMADCPQDIIVTGVCAILSAMPSRISEVCHLEAVCEVRESITGSDAPAFGLRWRPAKGGEAMVKWCTTSMADVVEEAVRRIRAVTEPAREIARWYESHPGQLYLPARLEHLRSEARLTLEQVNEIVFVEEEPDKTKAYNSGKSWCNERGIKIARGHARPEEACPTVAFEDVQRAVLRMLPRGFPFANKETGLRYSNALLVARRNELATARRTSSGIVELIDISAIRVRLAGSPGNPPNIFQRHGFTEEDGSVMRITTHQFRHYLNTIAQSGGLSELDIAKWSGRVNVAQNATYNHVSDRDVLALVREAIGDDTKMFGPLAKMPAKALIPRDEFSRLKVQTAHTTEFGYCIHDFTMLPCQIHRDCMNCDEQVCIKGDRPKEVAIRHCRDTTRELLAEAISNDKDGAFGASRWVEHQSRTLARLDQLCEILDNPRVPDGAVIQPAGVVPASRIEQATARRQKLIPSGKAPAEGLLGSRSPQMAHRQVGVDQ